MNFEVAWVLVSSETQVQPQIELDPDYLPDYLSVSYDYVLTENKSISPHQSKLGSVNLVLTNYLS